MATPHLSSFDKTRRSFRALLRNTAGAVAVMAGIAIPTVLGTTALAIDVGVWYLQRSELQSIADAVASSAALEFSYGNTYGIQEALADAALTGVDVSGITEISVNRPPLAGAYAGDNGAVEVELATPGTIFFAGFVFDDSFNVAARAVATTTIFDDACMVGLDQTAPQAIRASGNLTVDMDCGIASNSNDADSVWVNGNVNLNVPSLTTAGGIYEQPSGVIDGVNTRENTRRIDNPYSDLTPPFYSDCDYNNTSITSNAVLSPGTYCGGLSIGGSADVQFDPGTYIIDAGDFTISGNADVYGSGVTIILTSTTDVYGGIKITGGSDIDLSAPTSGDYQGIVFFQDPDADPDNTNMITGNADMHIEGALYLPVGHLDFGGNGVWEGECTQFIANSITITGDAHVGNDCDDMPIREMGYARAALVE